MKAVASLFFVLVCLNPFTAKAVEEVQITEWRVPWANTRPRDPYVDHQQRIWFVGQKGDYVAYLEPNTGTFKRFDLAPGTGPHNLLVDKDGSVWYAANRSAHIGKLNPQSGQITKYPMPNAQAYDPHTLVLDGQGAIWFTVQVGNFVGRLSPATGEIRLIPVPTPRALPYGIATDAHNRLWIAEFGSNKLAVVDGNTLGLREITLPRADSRPRRLAATADDKVWYVDNAQGYLGQLDPATGKIQEWPLPDGRDAGPYGMAADDRNRLWFVETGLQPNRLVGFDPATQKFFSVAEIKSGGGAVRNMYFYSPAGEIWFGTDLDTIGRAKVR